MNIVQIGANEGRDHVFELASTNKEKLNKLILVEPVVFLETKLRECYSDFPQAVFEMVGTLNLKLLVMVEHG